MHAYERAQYTMNALSITSHYLNSKWINHLLFLSNSHNLISSFIFSKQQPWLESWLVIYYTSECSTKPKLDALTLCIGTWTVHCPTSHKHLCIWNWSLWTGKLPRATDVEPANPWESPVNFDSTTNYTRYTFIIPVFRTWLGCAMSLLHQLTVTNSTDGNRGGVFGQIGAQTTVGRWAPFSLGNKPPRAQK